MCKWSLLYNIKETPLLSFYSLKETYTIYNMQPRSHAVGQQGENGNGLSRNQLHQHSPSWTSSSARRHLSPNNIVVTSPASSSSSTQPISPTNVTPPRPTSPRNNNNNSNNINTSVYSMVRERSLHRDEGGGGNSSRPPSIRSASSYGRPLNRLMHNAHTRRHSSYSNFSTMSETSLPWTTRDIGFNAISGKVSCYNFLFILLLFYLSIQRKIT